MTHPEIIAALTTLLQTVAKESGKKIAAKIFTGNDDKFLQVVKRVAGKLDSKYHNELFGGSLPNVLMKPTVVEKLKRILFPFDPPSIVDFEEDEIYFENLPPDFFDEIRQTLLEELIADQFFHDKVVSNFIAISVDNVANDVRTVRDDVKSILGLLTPSQTSDPSLPKKLSYQLDKTQIHIPKLLNRILNDASTFDLTVWKFRAT